MIPCITYQIEAGKDDQFDIDTEYVAFKGKKCYVVHRSRRTYTCGCTMGFVRAVFSEDGTKLLAVAPPLFALNNEFELVMVKLMNDYARKANAYKRLRKKYASEIPEQTTRSYSISG
jgi:hypothetical protein